MGNEFPDSEVDRAVLTRSNVHLIGRGTRPMLFSHGFGSDQSMWRFLTPHFADDWRIILHDLVGSGLSDRRQYSRSRYDSLDGYADDVLRICEILDLHDVVLVGHSVSSMVGVRVANREPARVDSLVMLGPSPRFLNDTDYVGGFERQDIEELLYLLESNHVAWAEQMAPLVMANADRPELAQELANSFGSMDAAIANHFAHVAFLTDSRAEVAKCDKPTLIVQCTDDPMVPITVGEYLRQTMDQAQLASVEASGHFPHLCVPDQVAQIMKGFLEQRVVG